MIVRKGETFEMKHVGKKLKGNYLSMTDSYGVIKRKKQNIKKNHKQKKKQEAKQT